MTENCVVCGVKKIFEGEGGYTAKDAKQDFLHHERSLKEKQVWVHSWLCYESYRERMARKFKLKLIKRNLKQC